jgi:hypothetical protein
VASLSPDEKVIIEHYVSRGIVAKLEDHYLYLATEPWRGAELRAELSFTSEGLGQEVRI